MSGLILVVILAANLRMLATSRLRVLVYWAAVQGALLGILSLITFYGHNKPGLMLVASMVICVKGFIIPALMIRTLNNVRITREIEPYVGYNLSLAVGLMAMALSFWLAKNLQMSASEVPNLALPTAFCSVFTGLFLIVARKKAVTQVAGFLVMENGIYALGAATATHIPWLVELGVLLDLTVVVFLMGLVIHNIQRAFNHIDIHELRRLKG